jgi:hypothetical protein
MKFRCCGIDAINEAREQGGQPTINSLWISGIGKLEDIRTPALFDNMTQIYGEHPLLTGLAKYLSIPHQSEIDFSKLENGFAWLTQPKSVWDQLKAALLHGELDEIEIIDFPNAQPRRRTLKAKDLHKKSWAFWKKSEPLTWQEIISS